MWDCEWERRRGELTPRGMGEAGTRVEGWEGVTGDGGIAGAGVILTSVSGMLGFTCGCCCGCCWGYNICWGM